MPLQGVALKFSFVDANAKPTGINEKQGKVNYFIGNEPEKWKTAIPTYGEIAYKNLYEGIDLVYKGEQGRLKYDLIVNPGADISKIRFACEGAEGLSIADTGDLVIKTAIGELRDTKPYAYQIINGEKKEVGAGFQIPPNPPLTKGGRGDFAYGFYVEDYDKAFPLIIDPSLAYSTFLGGGNPDWGFGIALDGSGNIYLTGATIPSNFSTTTGAYDTSWNGSICDVFVAKLSPTGGGASGLLYSTYLGGSSDDFGYGIAVNGSGNAYVTGYTGSSNFSTTLGAYQTIPGGGYDGFIIKLSPVGSDVSDLQYSTYYGGSGDDFGRSIDVDASGNVYVTGYTKSSNFPTTTNAYQSVLGGGNDAFSAKLQLLGLTANDLIYSTYLGSSSEDVGYDIAFLTLTGASVEDRVYITGYTASSGFPTAFGAYDTSFNGGTYDAFVSVFSFPVPTICVDAHDINLTSYCLGTSVEDIVTPLDALIILGLSVGAITPDMLSPALTPAAAAIIGDGDGDGILEPVDALIALGVAVGSVPPQAPNPRCVASSEIGTCP